MGPETLWRRSPEQLEPSRRAASPFPAICVLAPPSLSVTDPKPENILHPQQFSAINGIMRDRWIGGRVVVDKEGFQNVDGVFV